ncbi:exopolysaccharide biosynthesis protein YbjH [Rhodovulum bhavnagarense]|uniref:Exopolysaccharide biosynthesis protein YbjH n=1 Tax=Rhodovulum bhavnagarense TaxID=992286 RepID=A0A4R2RE14_9RHOB|nr:YjbH domain-containing protein [Rhodovulum bhavnagarense]TCP60237.1 exopolysaccharide biosynthesis protein YbjH [Rhodovulum bhavnagarense]
MKPILPQWQDRLRCLLLASASVLCGAGAAAAQPQGTLNTYGLPGLIDMPSARAMDDADLSLTFFGNEDLRRNTLSFQLTPRLTGSFRYSYIAAYDPAQTEYFDRSFDLHFLLMEETEFWPGLAVGVRDFIGTGVYSGEYVVLSRMLGSRLSATAGLGWGRLGSHGDIGSPFGARPPRDVGRGGTLEIDQWFKGPVAPFGGLEWRPSEKWSLIAEYSSDGYTGEVQGGIYDHRTPLNFGVTYRPRPGWQVFAHVLNGDMVGVGGAIVLNPRRPVIEGSLDPAPMAVMPRPPGPRDTGWIVDAGRVASERQKLVSILESQGYDVQSVALDGGRARVRLTNRKYDYEPQAIGRVARLMALSLPPSVERFEIVPTVQGLPLSMVTIRRSDLEELEHAPAGYRFAYQRAGFDAAPMRGDGEVFVPGRYPRFSWGLGSYSALSLFDPENPIRADIGLQLQADYDLAPGAVLSGALRAKLVGNLDQATRLSNSVLPHVRSDFIEYDRQGGDLGVQYLTFEKFGKIGPDFYTRMTLGYLETMYGGISGEVLWKPVDQRLGLGLELNYARQRDFDKGLGFRDYDVLTGHASAYVDLWDDFTGQIDVGRYLAGDWGATLSINRSFDNGWQVGAYATLTDVPFDTFGEGSFDKGIRLTIPFSWVAGTSSRKTFGTTITPVTRDGGARLSVRNRLYGLVSEYHQNELSDEWGRFWR